MKTAATYSVSVRYNNRTVQGVIVDRDHANDLVRVYVVDAGKSFWYRSTEVKPA